MDELEDEVPATTKFSLGYYEAGRQSTKKWLVTQEDLNAMYRTGNKDFLLWCDGYDDSRNDRRIKAQCHPSVFVRKQK